jgi:hypothetical protein
MRGAVKRLPRAGLFGNTNADKHNILTVTNDAGTAKFTTQLPHGLPGDGSVTVTITGTSDPAYNFSGNIVTATPTATTFESADIPYDVDATGGRWSTP